MALFDPVEPMNSNVGKSPGVLSVNVPDDGPMLLLLVTSIALFAPTAASEAEAVTLSAESV